jgi:hypothetical protein
MLAYFFLLVYAFVIGSGAAALFIATDRLEPNFWLATVLQVLVLLAVGAAIMNRLLAWAP